MPILPHEADLFPTDLFENPEHRGAAQSWWVLHTKPRQEKSLARELHAAGTAFYLPLIARRTQMRDRVVTSHVPLFDGYVFLHADNEARITALATSRVVHSLPVADQDALWRDLGQVHRLIRTGAPITPEDRLAPGMSVEIRHGPLAGLRGKILESASRRRFVVQVDFIQRGASVLLDDIALAPASDSTRN
jgi:transcriptional antiterminator RfaH